MTTSTNLPRSTERTLAHGMLGRGTPTSVGQLSLDTQSMNADGAQLPASQAQGATQIPSAGGDLLAGAIPSSEAQTLCAPAMQRAAAIPPENAQTVSAAAPKPGGSHSAGDAQNARAAADRSSACSQLRRDAHTSAAPGGWLRDPVLGVLADVVDDLESVRIANANRVRQLTRTGMDKDGEERGFGLTADHPEVAKLILTVQTLEAAEHDAILNLKRAMRKHPLAGFQKRHKGIGEKQLARLLAVIGDPYWNDLHERPRTVSELWAYCGFHVIKTSDSSQGSGGTHMPLAAAGNPRHTESHIGYKAQESPALGVAPKRLRGQRSNWSEAARKRVWVIASSMPKFSGGHYEKVYRQAREKYAESVHAVECVRCGPSGKPALPGSQLSDGHKHARAIRIVAKEILKDLWIEARDLYEPSTPVSRPGAEVASPATRLLTSQSLRGMPPTFPTPHVGDGPS